MRKFSVSGLLLVALSLIGLPAYAQTPDGQTPANEKVCDVVKGGSPGLYGLCVAYCEAQDLNTFLDKGPPSSTILANYRKKMQAGDPDMPCVKKPCPCWSDAELAAITGDGQYTCQAAKDGSFIHIIDRTKQLHQATWDNRQVCSFINETVSPPVVRKFQLSKEESTACAEQLALACNQLP